MLVFDFIAADHALDFEFVPPARGSRRMPRKPNYQFERLDRERIKAAKAAEKAQAKRELKEREERAKTGGTSPED
jgi:hypothetical protein